MLADLALSNVARRNISELTPSEHRRVVIGTQLVKDPGNSTFMMCKHVINAFNFFVDILTSRYIMLLLIKFDIVTSSHKFEHVFYGTLNEIL